ncbi:hypothetical protein CXG81DRAFT_15155, partial [Caulochytrium protostelioides]
MASTAPPEHEPDVEDHLAEEILDLYNDFPGLAHRFRIVTKIGEGTFSSVYKAEDRLWASHHVAQAQAQVAALEANSGVCLCRMVALKRIYVTSSPQRIYNELKILDELGGHPNVGPLITILRHEDQVLAVLPYFQFDDWRQLQIRMDMDQIRSYLRALLRGLAHVHAKNYIHRDIKPSNFLYNMARRTGIIVDFGLAQEVRSPTAKERAQIDAQAAKYPVRATTNLQTRIRRMFPGAGGGCFAKDTRPSIRANRAGTRGFRAPEVLFKVVHQTPVVDIWSVGVILLSLFSGRFPFFNATDDQEALLEIAHLFGREAMQAAARTFRRTFNTNVPSVSDPVPLRTLCQRLWSERYRDIPDEGFDFLERLLTLNPAERLTAEAALRHPFLAEPEP